MELYKQEDPCGLLCYKQAPERLKDDLTCCGIKYVRKPRFGVVKWYFHLETGWFTDCAIIASTQLLLCKHARGHNFTVRIKSTKNAKKIMLFKDLALYSSIHLHGTTEVTI